MRTRRKLPVLLAAGHIAALLVLDAAMADAMPAHTTSGTHWSDAHIVYQNAVVGDLEANPQAAGGGANAQPAPKSDPNDPRDRLDRALKAATEGGQKAAQRELKSLTNDPEWGAYARYNLGVLAYEEGDVKKAQEYIDNALEADPGFGPAAVAKVRQFLYDNNVSGAQSFVNAQLSASKQATGIRTAALYIALYQKDYQRVISDTRAILIDDPANLDTYYALAMANLALGRTELADYILKQANDREPNRADIYYAMGQLAYETGDREEARRNFQTAIKINPSYPEAKVALSELQLRKMEYADVVDALTPVVKTIPNYVDAWINYGSGLKGIGKSKEAKTAFEKALELEPQSAAATFNIAILYLDVADFEGLAYKERLNTALEWFQKYRNLAGRVEEDDPVNAYEQFAHQEIEMQEELERQDREAEERRKRKEQEEKDRKEKGDDGGGDGWNDDGGWGDDDDW